MQRICFPFIGHCRKSKASTIGNHLLRCRIIASVPGTGSCSPGRPSNPIGNDNTDAVIGHHRVS